MRPARKYSHHAARSADTQPASLMTMTLPRCGVTASIAVHPSFRQPALSLDLCYLLGQISPCSKQWVKLNRLRSGTARVGDRLKLWGVQESEMCTCGHITQSVHHAGIHCNIYKAPDGFAGLPCPDAALGLGWKTYTLKFEGMANDYI